MSERVDTSTDTILCINAILMDGGWTKEASQIRTLLAERNSYKGILKQVEQELDKAQSCVKELLKGADEIAKLRAKVQELEASQTDWEETWTFDGMTPAQMLKRIRMLEADRG